MKKLMITAAALLTACVVGAAVQGGERVSGTDFNSYPTGAFNPALDDDGASDMGTYWTTTQAGESVVEEKTEGDNILKIDESVPLYRNMFKSNADKQSATVDVEQSVYFQSKVKFTASEDETMTPSEGDKLIVWVRATEENPTTNLIVTAGIYEDGQWGTSNYVVDQPIDVDDWHDLEIVAKMDDSVLKFEVKVDGSAVTSDETTLFPSLDQYSDYRSTITCAGFKGSGWVDDIEFGTIAENPTKYYEVDGESYITFAKALEAAASAEDPTIKLINDAVLEFNEEEYGAGYLNAGNLTIDLAGCTISCAGAVFANSQGATLTIIDSSEDGDGAVVNTLVSGIDDVEHHSIDNLGSLIISGGKFKGLVCYDEEDSSTAPVVTLDGNPAKLVLDDNSESDTYGYYIIKDSGEQPPVPTVVQIPTAESNLVYDGTEQTGVAAGTGYTLTGTAAATNAGDYTATATLAEGYIWSDDTTEAKTINWSIAPKTDAEVVVTLTSEIAEYSAQLEFPTASATIGGDDVAGTPAWDPNAISEPDAGATNTYTVTFTVTTANYAGSFGTATFKVYKAEGGDDYPSYIEPSDTETKAKYDTWADTYNVVDGAGNKEAFLLNCAPADVETEKENFKVTITVNADGTVTVTAPDGYNVTPKIQGKQTLSNTEAWHDKKDGDKFFRAVLDL